VGTAFIANSSGSDQPNDRGTAWRSGLHYPGRNVKIHVEQADGRDVTLAILGRGDTVGEMSLVDSGALGQRADVGRFALALDGQNRLCGMPARHPRISQNLVRILSGRVRLANELIQALATLDVYGEWLASCWPLPINMVSCRGRRGAHPIRRTQGDISELVGRLATCQSVMVVFKQSG